MADFRTAASLDPKTGRYPTSIAYAFFAREQYDDAEEQLEKVVKEFPKEVDAWWLLGETRYRKGEMEQSVEAFSRSSPSTPSAPARRKRWSARRRSTRSKAASSPPTRATSSSTSRRGEKTSRRRPTRWQRCWKTPTSAWATTSASAPKA